MNDITYDDAACWLSKKLAHKARDSEEARAYAGSGLEFTHFRDVPRTQNWKMEFDKGAEWREGFQRNYAWCTHITRTIYVNATYFLNELNHEKLLQTVAHEFGHAMTMFGGHARQSLFRPWARYFGETKPQQFDKRDAWTLSLTSKCQNEMPGREGGTSDSDGDSDGTVVSEGGTSDSEDWPSYSEGWVKDDKAAAREASPQHEKLLRHMKTLRI
jgi:hypothetical protein